MLYLANIKYVITDIVNIYNSIRSIKRDDI